MDDTVYQPPTESKPPTPRRPHMSIRKAMEWVFVKACAFGFLAMVSRYQEANGGLTRQQQCARNLTQISLALANYQSLYDKFPPAFVADAHGKPVHSWRVLILPLMEQQALYDRYNFQEAWDGPGNIKLVDQIPSCFRHPGSASAKGGQTCYLAIKGPGTIFPGANSFSFDSAMDVGLNTLMVVEDVRDPVPWTSPHDLEINKMSFRVNGTDQPGLSSRHADGANAAFGGVKVLFLPDSTSPEVLKAMTQVAGHPKRIYRP